MTNLQKINELVDAESSKEQVISWAYMNRIWLSGLPEEEEFASMKASVDDFMSKKTELRTEYDMWDNFLDREFIESEGDNAMSYVEILEAIEREEG